MKKVALLLRRTDNDLYSIYGLSSRGAPVSLYLDNNKLIWCSPLWKQEQQSTKRKLISEFRRFLEDTDRSQPCFIECDINRFQLIPKKLIKICARFPITENRYIFYEDVSYYYTKK